MARGGQKTGPMAEEILYGAAETHRPRVISASQQPYWPLKVDLGQLLVDDHTFFLDHQGYSGNFYWGVRKDQLPAELYDHELVMRAPGAAGLRKSSRPQIQPQQRDPGADEARWLDQLRTAVFIDDDLQMIEFLSEMHRDGGGASWWSATTRAMREETPDTCSINTHVATFIEQQAETAGEWLYHQAELDRITFTTMLYVSRGYTGNKLLGWYVID